MAKQDFYDLLGVGRDASGDDIKKAFRKLAMQCHPDRNPGDKQAEQRFKDINEAYDVLKDEQRRAAYDRFGHAAFEQGGGRGDFGFGGAGGFADIFEEMFGSMMGGGGGRSANNRGSDLRYNLEITLEEAFKGRETQIRVPTLAPCDACQGSGAEPGSKPINCPTCRGAGRVRTQQGFFTMERTCPACHGAGKVIDKPCRSCGGQGRTRKEKTLNVTIPPGVEDGTRIRLASEGEAGLRGGGNGDLYIFLAVNAHPLFQRDGANIHCRVPISMPTAALGGTIEVPTIDGSRAKVTIPRGHPDRPSVPPARQRHVGAAQRDARRHVRPSQCRDTGPSDQAAARAAARIREGRRCAQDQSRKRGLLRQGEGVLRGSARIAS